MDFVGLLVLGALWLLLNRLGKAGEGARSRGASPGLPPAPGGLGDATQREGSRLEALFRELERTLNEASAPPAGPRPRPPVLLPPDEEVEERASLETDPSVVSLEQEVRRPVRARADRDEQAEGIEAARVAAAEARSGAHTRRDHAEFDARIRREPADATAVRTPNLEQLRKAIIWREILGPPASLKTEEETLSRPE